MGRPSPGWSQVAT